MLCEPLAGPTIVPSGPEVVLASLSARQARAAGLLMSGTYGPRGTTSSASAVLQSCLVSRLRQRTAFLGSTLFNQTWKVRDTPSHRSICALRASALRTSGNAYGSWPTPNLCDSTRRSPETPDAKKARGAHTGTSMIDTAHLASWPTPRASNVNSGPGDATKAGDGTCRLERDVHLASWPTPAVQNADGGPNPSGVNNGNYFTLQTAALLSSWVTPMSRDWKDSPGMATTGMNPDGSVRSRMDQLPRQVQLTVFGTTHTGSPVTTARRGQLNPAHSRWLMGLIRAWDDLAPYSQEWDTVQRKLAEYSGDHEAFSHWLVEIGLEDSGALETH
jgi:hypothetical protein